jgi:hypothetical protein
LAFDSRRLIFTDLRLSQAAPNGWLAKGGDRPRAFKLGGKDRVRQYPEPALEELHQLEEDTSDGRMFKNFKSFYRQGPFTSDKSSFVLLKLLNQEKNERWIPQLGRHACVA